MGMVHHHPEDQASYRKVGQCFRHLFKYFTLILRPDPNEELRLLEEKAAATYGVYKEKCDTKVSLSLVSVILELSLHCVAKL